MREGLVVENRQKAPGWMRAFLALLASTLGGALWLTSNGNADVGVPLSAQELRATLGGGFFQKCTGLLSCNQGCQQVQHGWFHGSGGTQRPVCEFWATTTCVMDKVFYCPGTSYTDDICQTNPQPASLTTWKCS
jgi:hypothetical protein